ncbi:MAG: PIN domain-containing protein, partial [Gemmataceae bacterium]
LLLPVLLLPFSGGIVLLKPLLAVVSNVFFGILGSNLAEVHGRTLLRLFNPASTEALLVADGVLTPATAKILDTSVIIDGRIADLCDTRIIDTRLIVPRFILQELQGIADSSDKMKRNRGRRGLDILKKLQTTPKIDLVIHEGNAGELKPGERMRVDERLVAFAKVMGGRVVTNDFNLNKMAQLQGVEVINLNEVANALKTVSLPGEYLTLKVVKPGDQIGQGVGYLDDGTMVVVEHGRNHIGQEVSIVVTSVLQTPAGRMIFGRPEQRLSGGYAPVGSSGAHQPVKPDENNTKGANSPPPPEPPKS